MKRLTVVGLDLGTSAVKAVLLDESGRVMAEATAEYPLSTPRPGWSEQAPAEQWHVLCMRPTAGWKESFAYDAEGLTIWRRDGDEEEERQCFFTT